LEDSFNHLRQIKKIALIGTGLIGGSIGLALKERMLATSLVCYDRDINTAREAVARGAADQAAQSLEEVVHDAELVILAVPVLSTLEILKEIIPYLKDNTLITDVGSTKGSIMAAVEQLLPPGTTYIGGHPMTGSEEIGINGADPGLLENAIYVITPLPGTDPNLIAKLSALIERIGAQPLVMEPLSHDRIVALVSHLPHLMAAVLVQSVAGAGDMELVRTLAAGGFRDSTRIVLGNPEIWRDIFISNRWSLLPALKNFKASLEQLENALTEPSAETIYEYLNQARDYRRAIPHRGRGILPDLFEIIVLVRDVPGAIGKLTTLLGEEQINIDAIEILHVRELSGGSVRFGFRSEEQQKMAVQLLNSHDYQVFIR